jgi:hypothetical protein
MDSDEIIWLLKTNIDRTVTVTFSDGQSLPVLVLNVDDEGFVYDLVPKDEKTAYWTVFDDIADVKPLAL